MFGSVVLEVAIGMGFIYLILSLICSTVQELIARIFELRSNMLYEGIENLLQDPNLRDTAKEVYKHPLVRNLAREGMKPSYIPARNFSLALLDVLKDPNTTGGALSEAHRTVRKLPPGPLRESLSTLIEDSGGKIEDVRKSIEAWFDDAMDRVSGWYKRKAQNIVLVIAFILAIGLNVDSVKVAGVLWENPTLRAEIVALAEQQTSQAFTDVQMTRMSELSSQLNALPIGWPVNLDASPYNQPFAIVVIVVGWIVTAFAVSLGAPFWFDALGKLINLRSAGQAPKKTAS
jgi:hypothetical protein